MELRACRPLKMHLAEHFTRDKQQLLLCLEIFQRGCSVSHSRLLNGQLVCPSPLWLSSILPGALCIRMPVNTKVRKKLHPLNSTKLMQHCWGEFFFFFQNWCSGQPFLCCATVIGFCIFMKKEVWLIPCYFWIGEGLLFAYMRNGYDTLVTHVHLIQPPLDRCFLPVLLKWKFMSDIIKERIPANDIFLFWRSAEKHLGFLVWVGWQLLFGTRAVV